MKNSTILILGALAVSAVFVANKTKTTLKALDIKFKGIHINKSIKNLMLSGNLKYSITNPTSTDVVLQYFKGKLYYGNFYITDIIINQTKMIPNSVNNLNVDFSTPILAMAGEIQKIMANGWFIQQFHVEGTLIYKVGNFPEATTRISQNIDLSDKYESKKA